METPPPVHNSLFPPFEPQFKSPHVFCQDIACRPPLSNCTGLFGCHFIRFAISPHFTHLYVYFLLFFWNQVSCVFLQTLLPMEKTWTLSTNQNIIWPSIIACSNGHPICTGLICHKSWKVCSIMTRELFKLSQNNIWDLVSSSFVSHIAITCKALTLYACHAID